MAHDVFISYSSKDKPAADATCAALENALIRSWMAPRDVAPGADWSTSIMEAISASRVFLLIFSGHANTSRHVQRELQHACDQGLAIIPFRLEGVLPTGGMKFYLGTIHWLDALTPPMERHHELLVTAIKALLPVVTGVGTTAIPAPAVRTPEPPVVPVVEDDKQRPHKWRWLGWAAVVGAVFVYTSFWAWHRDGASLTVPTSTLAVHPTSAVALAPGPASTSTPYRNAHRHAAVRRRRYLDFNLVVGSPANPCACIFEGSDPFVRRSFPKPGTEAVFSMMSRMRWLRTAIQTPQ